jgi:radical SAM superfamily enzyme
MRNLDGMNKGFNRLDRLAQAVDLLHQHGIGVEAGIVLGLPKDDERVFESTSPFASPQISSPGVF